MMADIRPNHSLYINNLNDHVKKDELKRQLYALFGQFGQVLDVVALRTGKMRGQAFVVFKEIAAASTARRAMQGFMFYEKPMRVNYSKTDSNIIREAKGLAPRPKSTGDMKKVKRKKIEITVSTAVHTSEKAPQEEEDVEPLKKNKVLFVSNIPNDLPEKTLDNLFSQFPGVVELRPVAGRHDIAFVEYESESQADAARLALHNHKVTPDGAINVAFAKVEQPTGEVEVRF